MNTDDMTELDDYFTQHDTNVDFDQTFQLEIHLANGNFQSKYQLVKLVNFYIIKLLFVVGVESVRYFICKKLRYIWDMESQSFLRLHGLDVNVPSMTMHTEKGISASTRKMR